MEIKLKPWGREIWFAHTSKYVGKILELKKGHRFSLQYHEEKHETQYIGKGEVKVSLGEIGNAQIEVKDKTPSECEKNLKKIILSQGESIEIPPFTIHRAEALEDSEIFEVSTTELEDVVKIKDDYGRKGKGNNEENDKLLAKNN